MALKNGHYKTAYSATIYHQPSYQDLTMNCFIVSLNQRTIAMMMILFINRELKHMMLGWFSIHNIPIRFHENQFYGLK
jgi:hypothetical protein